VSQDDGIRQGTTKEGLGKIRAAFPQWKPATTTGGNASQITDGAAAVLLMKRSRAEELGQPIIAKFVKSTTVGLEPRIMGIGPSYAIPKVLKLAGLNKEDVDLFEINEAFASMYVFCVQNLGLDIEKVNVRGGAIAIGHPLGCTGTRQVVTVLSELRRRKQKVAVTSMCVGTVSVPFRDNFIEITMAGNGYGWYLRERSLTGSNAESLLWVFEHIIISSPPSPPHSPQWSQNTESCQPAPHATSTL
jgi:acetyl-CoA acetyltransferase family protein